MEDVPVPENKPQTEIPATHPPAAGTPSSEGIMPATVRPENSWMKHIQKVPPQAGLL